jgi:hypothetical protein
MSSPWDRKTFFVSPGRFAKPKNFRVMGGGGGIAGSGRTPASASVAPERFGVSIFATDPATKIFLPLPAYLICSLWFSNARSSVGSNRGSNMCSTFPDAVRRPPARGGAETAGVAAGAASGDEGQNWLPSNISATAPNTDRTITCVRFSVPNFTQAPIRRKLCIVICSLTGPALSPAKSTPSTVKKSFERSRVLMKRTSCR